ncbi:MAG TPA: ATP synthase F0 subunit B [Bryobacteraceae bacterium]|nr:ATP synthase F0 subunit B [Bryobacteraceae bacterium]
MKRLAGGSVAALVLLLFLKSPAPAQPHESEAQRVAESSGVTERGPNVFWGWLNFILLAGGLGYLIKKHGGPYFAQRSLEIRKGIADAETARAASDAKVAEVGRRLANLQTEIDSLRRSAQQEAEADAQRVRREAAAELAKIQAHAAEEIASAGKSATLELRRYSGDLALALAARKIAARMSPETQDRLVGSFVAAMAHTAGD